MGTRISIEPLCVEHLEELATELRHPAVYEHIGPVPTLDDFILDRKLALAGPGSISAGEFWFNFLVRHGDDNSVLGRIEATVHDSMVEVAFLFGPRSWGQGYAREALQWLHSEVIRRSGVGSFWAATTSANIRCQGLLRRCGYEQTSIFPVALRSYEDGDLVFHLQETDPP